MSGKDYVQKRQIVADGARDACVGCLCYTAETLTSAPAVLE